MNIYKAIARILSMLYQILVSGGERDTRELEDILSNPPGTGYTGHSG